MFGKGISGYEVGDGKEDANNRLIYMTDGFLKMKALFDFKVFDEIDVLMIDEIH
jgi:HrpA-like RNA helicase